MDSVNDVTLALLLHTLDEIILHPFIQRQQNIVQPKIRLRLLQSIAASEHSLEPVHEQLQNYIQDRTGTMLNMDALHTLAMGYQACLDVAALVAFMPTVAYSGKVEFSVVATKDLERSTTLSALFGLLVPASCHALSPDDADRSLISIGREDLYLLGPASRVNHRCDAPNAELAVLDVFLGYKRVIIRTKKDILRGEEICIHYGPGYFASGSCLCAGCEAAARNGWASRDVPSSVGVGQTRLSKLATERIRLDTKVYAYSDIHIPLPRISGDHQRLLHSMPKTRCMREQCRVLISSGLTEAFCGCCSERIPLLGTSHSALHRYYVAMLRGSRFLEPNGATNMFKHMSLFLQALHIPGWRVHPHAVGFNNQKHKEMEARCQHVRDTAYGASCSTAISAGAVQSGHIWLLVGQWRPDPADSIASMRSTVAVPYPFIMMLRNQQIFLMDPCYTRSLSETRCRLSELRSLARSRAMLDVMRKKRVNTSKGLFLGSWRSIDPELEVHLSPFVCSEFLVRMETSKILQEDPSSWAREEVMR